MGVRGLARALFGELVSLATTRQEVLFLEGGPGWDRAPAWVDYDRAMYGTGDVDALGFKAAYDAEGPSLGPDEELTDTATTEPQVRDYMGVRFPALEQARLVGARSCRYELTPDSRFIAAPHPAHPDVWLVGGGSVHGFKHGPAMAERSPRRSPGSRAASPVWAGRAPALAEPANGRLERELIELAHRRLRGVASGA